VFSNKGQQTLAAASFGLNAHGVRINSSQRETGFRQLRNAGSRHPWTHLRYELKIKFPEKINNWQKLIDRFGVPATDS
jgi:hypothetical protein